MGVRLRRHAAPCGEAAPHAASYTPVRRTPACQQSVSQSVGRGECCVGVAVLPSGALASRQRRQACHKVGTCMRAGVRGSLRAHGVVCGACDCVHQCVCHPVGRCACLHEESGLGACTGQACQAKRHTQRHLPGARPSTQQPCAQPTRMPRLRTGAGCWVVCVCVCVCVCARVCMRCEGV